MWQDYDNEDKLRHSIPAPKWEHVIAQSGVVLITILRSNMFCIGMAVGILFTLLVGKLWLIWKNNRDW